MDVDAVEFFRDLISLSKIRDSTLKALPNPAARLQQDYFSGGSDHLRAASTELKMLLRRNPRLDFIIRPDSNLREIISDLSHYNAIQIVDSHLYADHSYEGVKAARTNLQIILEASNEAWKALCLWLVFLHCLFSDSI